MLKVMTEVSYGRVVQDALLKTQKLPTLVAYRHAVVNSYWAQRLHSRYLPQYLRTISLTAGGICIRAKEMAGDDGHDFKPGLVVHGVAAVLGREVALRVNVAERLFGRSVGARTDELGRYRGGPLVRLSQHLPEPPRNSEAYADAQQEALYTDVNNATGSRILDARVSLARVEQIVDEAAMRQILEEADAYRAALAGYRRAS